MPGNSFVRACVRVAGCVKLYDRVIGWSCGRVGVGVGEGFNGGSRWWWVKLWRRLLVSLNYDCICVEFRLMIQ